MFLIDGMKSDKYPYLLTLLNLLLLHFVASLFFIVLALAEIFPIFRHSMTVVSACSVLIWEYENCMDFQQQFPR